MAETLDCNGAVGCNGRKCRFTEGDVAGIPSIPDHSLGFVPLTHSTHSIQVGFFISIRRGSGPMRMHDPFKTASGVQNPGPWDPWLPVVENSRLFAQRGHSARRAP